MHHVKFVIAGAFLITGTVHALAQQSSAARVPTTAGTMARAATTPPGVTLAVEVSRFDADESGAVTLTARWETLGPAGAPLRPPSESTIVEPGSGKDAAAVATTMSRAVAALAARIAAGLR